MSLLTNTDCIMKILVTEFGLSLSLSDKPCDRVWILPREKWELLKSSNLERDTVGFALI